ncbi:hypothetical protein D6D08_05333 [Aureobasidium pullulans]|nr:hypothetical protein D6D08_05333 [Aureobasidium pullulans]
MSATSFSQQRFPAIESNSTEQEHTFLHETTHPHLTTSLATFASPNQHSAISSKRKETDDKKGHSTYSEQHEGDLTYYGTGLGSCGLTSTDSDMIVAVSHYVFDAASRSSDPNQNPLCGLKLRASRYDEQVGERRSVDLKVVDRCVGCAATDIDVSPAAFDKLAARASGRVDVTWAWLSPQATA